jgi:choline-glycine betaine transporter
MMMTLNVLHFVMHEWITYSLTGLDFCTFTTKREL